MPNYCPNCGKYVRLGKGWGASRLYCSQKCSHEYPRKVAVKKAEN